MVIPAAAAAALTSVLARLNGAGGGMAEEARKSVYAVEQGTFSFGAVVPSQAPKLGVSERFKISNPNKIKAMVNFNITMIYKELKGYEMNYKLYEELIMIRNENAGMEKYLARSDMPKYPRIRFENPPRQKF